MTRSTTHNKRWQERGWQTYGDAHAYFREIIKLALEAGYEPDKQPLHPEYTETLCWLFKGDPAFEEKTTSGVRYFTLHRPYGFDKTKVGFAAVDNAGAVHHFSVRVCLGHTPRKSRVSDAFKAEVADELRRIRKQFSGQFCFETNEPLSEANLALDYQGLGFKQILETFLFAEGYSQLRDVELDDEGVADRALATRWQAYFAVNARIVGVSKRGLKIRNERRKQDPFWGMTT